MDALLGMLAPDVVFHGDGGGKAQAIGKPPAGRQRVIRLLVGGLCRARTVGGSLRLAWVNGQPGAVISDANERVVAVIELDVADGMVQAIRAVANPDKLRHIGPVSDLARRPGDAAAELRVVNARLRERSPHRSRRGRRPGGSPAGPEGWARRCSSATVPAG